MFKFNRIVWVLALGVVVSMAYGAALKIKDLVPVGLGAIESPDADGMAIMNYHPGHTDTEVQIAVTDLLPNTDYRVAVVPGILGGYITTNVSGNGHYHGTISTDVCLFESEICVYIYVDEGPEPNMQRAIDGSEDRLAGCVPCP